MQEERGAESPGAAITHLQAGAAEGPAFNLLSAGLSKDRLRISYVAIPQPNLYFHLYDFISLFGGLVL